MYNRCKYVYEGPVMVFGSCVCDKWRGETYAESVNKAKNNLAYQYKKKCNLVPSARIELPGTIRAIG